jgi:trigger factor
VLVAAVGAGKFRAACVEHLLQATLEEIMFPVKAAAFQDSERIVTPVADMAACFSGASCAPSVPLSLSVECDVLPTVSWAKPYERLAIRVPAAPTDAVIAADAEKMLMQKLRDCGELRVVSEGRGIQRSDVARLNVSAAHKKPDGTPGDLIMSMQHRNLFYDTEADGTTNLPGFDEAVAGMKAAETRSFELTFPPQWATETLRGVTALFTVHCTEHFCRTLPKLEDTIAPRLREGCADLASARAAFLGDARARAAAQQEESKRVAVLEELARCTSVEVPQSLLDETGRQLYSAKLLDLQAKGQLSPVAMRQMMADSLIEQYFKHNRDDIRSKVLAQLAIIDIARRERLEASPEAVAAEVARGKAEFKRFGQECDEERLVEQAQEGLLSQAVIDWLVDRADVTHA